VPRFSATCHTRARRGYAVCLSLFLLFFAPSSFAADLPTPERGMAEDKSALTPPSAPRDLTVGEGAIKGDSKSKLHYFPSCPEYGWLSPQQVIVFSSEEVAQQAGYHKAPTCR
jgi:hypothetical protein